MTTKITLVVFNPLPQRARQRRVQALCLALEEINRSYVLVATDADLKVTTTSIHTYLPTAAELIVVGGDGTLHQVVNALGNAYKTLPIGYIPAGTGNDFARAWYGTKLTTAGYIKRALHGKAECIDIGQANERYFINSVGVGFDGDLIAHLGSKKSWWPRLTYLVCALKQIFSYRGEYLQATGSDPALACLDKTPTLIFVAANMRYFGAGMLIAPHAKPNNGCLAWVHVQECRLAVKLQSFSSIYRGSHLTNKVVTSGQLSEMVIATAQIPMQTDGEYAGCTPVKIRCVPQAVSIRR